MKSSLHNTLDWIIAKVEGLINAVTSTFISFCDSLKEYFIPLIESLADSYLTDQSIEMLAIGSAWVLSIILLLVIMKAALTVVSIIVSWTSDLLFKRSFTLLEWGISTFFQRVWAAFTYLISLPFRMILRIFR